MPNRVTLAHVTAPDNAIEGIATLVWLDDEVVHVEAKGVASTRESAMEMFGTVNDLLGGTPKPVLFDARRWPSGDPEMWATIITNLKTTFTAVAMLIDPESPAEMGEYPSIIDRLLVPFRIFTDETEALTFLKQDHRPR